MPTSYTKTNDIATSWNEAGALPSEALLLESGEELLMESGESLDQELFDTEYTKEADRTTVWPSFFGLIRLATEGLRELLMNEDESDYLVVSHGDDVDIWTDIADSSTTYTKISDI